MTKRIRNLIVLVIGGLLLSSCQVQGTHTPAFWQPLPEQPLYALRGGGRDSSNHNNGIFVIDPATWKVLRRTHLPRARSSQIDQDPRGRLWVGLGESAGFAYLLWYGDSDDILGSLLPRSEGMLVLSPGGRRLAKLDTCKNPTSGVEFGKDKAFVVCVQSSQGGQVDVFDLKTFKKIGVVQS